MKEDPLQRVLAVFRDACELPRGERAAFLDQACGVDGDLRREVEWMLAWNDTEDERHDQAAAQPMRQALAEMVERAETAASSLPGAIGGYRVVRLIAHGGMGVVYEAEQDNPARRVAIKVARIGGATGERARRFELEAQLLARLRHPGIAQIIEAGTTSDAAGAQPFFVMEYVDGVPLTQYASARQLGVRPKLELMVRVCAAIACAHQHGVIHRDLKPDNVLIQADGAPKVLDFGVAKVEAAGGFGAATLRTEAGRVLGTLGYMAPEQLGGVSEGLGAAADVYSLGVLVYQLLSGRLPHEFEGATLTEALAVVTTTDAPLLGIIRPEFRGDIEAVVAKALEKDARYRYADAAALQQDLERFLADEPVLARRHSVLHRLRKFTRRNRGLVAGVGIAMAALSAGLFAALHFAAGEAQQRQVAGQSLRDYDLLAQDRHCALVMRAEQDLYPAWPDKLEAMQAWIADCDSLLAMRGGIDATAKGLQARGQSISDGQRILLDTLTELLPKLDRLEAGPRSGVVRGIAWASRIEALTNDHPQARVSWAQASSAIAKADDVVASARYAEAPVALSPQIGLVPIGMNPLTRLWEFYHLFSAGDGGADPSTIAIPELQPDGSIQLTAEMGIVFVLIPGGRFLMGSQNDQPESPNYDPDYDPKALPLRLERCREVPLPAYFLSKYELTQGQWQRLTGNNPSEHQHAPNLPVQMVRWSECEAVMRRLGLMLPTGEQWERAARGGTTTKWWTGATAATLEGAENIWEQVADANNPGLAVRNRTTAAAWSDESKRQRLQQGRIGPAEVGSYRPNPFGLYDMSGNVAEWCSDAPPGQPYRAARGGACTLGAHEARSAVQQVGSTESRFAILGLRAARSLRP